MTPSRLFSPLRASAAKPPNTLVHKASGFPGKAVLALTIATLCAAASAPTASAQTVAYTGSAVNFGTANVCPSGKTVPAPCSQTLTLTYNVTESGTLGTPQALTLGAPNLDYNVASGTTCSGSVSKGSTCKVKVAFAPTQPGARNGAVEVIDGSGKVLSTILAYGNGVGPRLGFDPAVVRTIAGSSSTYGGSYGVQAIAVDGYGNIFAGVFGTIDTGSYLAELLAVDGSVPANPVVKVLASNFPDYYPFGDVRAVALDGAGNLFYAVNDYLVGGSVYEMLAADGYATSTTINVGGNFLGTGGLAIDGSGNLFVSVPCSQPNDGNTIAGGLLEVLAAGGYTTTKTLGGAVQFPLVGSEPSGIALDANGNVFLANFGNVLELTPSDGYDTAKTINVGPSDNYYYDIAADPAGNLFVDGVEFLAVDGVLPTNPASRNIAQIGEGTYAITLDARGNLYANSYTAGLQELQLSAPPTLNFAQTAVGHVSTDSPQSVEIQNEGNAPLNLTGLSLDSSNWELVKVNGTPEDCAAGTTLVSSALCDIGISFEPMEAGPLNGAFTLTDNSLNAPGSAQSISLTGAGIASPHIASLNTTYGAPYSVVYVIGDNFSASAGSDRVTFNGIAASVYYSTGTFILATVPGGATTGDVVVTVDGVASNRIPFTVLPMPKVTGISPTSGPAGTVVAISGSNLVDYENKGKVGFNGKYLPILSETSTAITVVVPTGAFSENFHVLVNDTGINTPTFTVTK